MKYYITEITRYVEPVSGKTEVYGLYNYDDERTAKANYYAKMGVAMKNDNCALEILSVMDDRGVMIVNPDVYKKPVEPTPEPESEVEA